MESVGYPDSSTEWPSTPQVWEPCISIHEILSDQPPPELEESATNTTDEKYESVSLSTGMSVHESKAGFLDEQTALHLATKSGHENIVAMLLDVVGSVNDTNKLGQSALHLAVEKGHNAVARLLIIGALISISKMRRAGLHCTWRQNMDMFRLFSVVCEICQ